MKKVLVPGLLILVCSLVAGMPAFNGQVIERGASCGGVCVNHDEV